MLRVSPKEPALTSSCPTLSLVFHQRSGAPLWKEVQRCVGWGGGSGGQKKNASAWCCLSLVCVVHLKSTKGWWGISAGKGTMCQSLTTWVWFPAPTWYKERTDSQSILWFLPWHISLSFFLTNKHVGKKPEAGQFRNKRRQFYLMALTETSQIRHWASFSKEGHLLHWHRVWCHRWEWRGYTVCIEEPNHGALFSSFWLPGGPKGGTREWQGMNMIIVHFNTYIKMMRPIIL